jgi:hypothetical protein
MTFRQQFRHTRASNSSGVHSTVPPTPCKSSKFSRQAKLAARYGANLQAGRVTQGGKRFLDVCLAAATPKALDINDHGQIVGNAATPHGNHAFVRTPIPERATLCLAAIALLLATSGRRML